MRRDELYRLTGMSSGQFRELQQAIDSSLAATRLASLAVPPEVRTAIESMDQTARHIRGSENSIRQQLTGAKGVDEQAGSLVAERVAAVDRQLNQLRGVYHEAGLEAARRADFIKPEVESAMKGFAESASYLEKFERERYGLSHAIEAAGTMWPLYQEVLAATERDRVRFRGLLDDIDSRRVGQASSIGEVAPYLEEFRIKQEAMNLHVQTEMNRFSEFARVFQQEHDAIRSMAAGRLDDVRAVLDAAPFGAAAVSELRSFLGDHRDVDLYSLSTASVLTRSAAYRGLGFDPLLVSFPRGEYWNVLDDAQIPADSPVVRLSESPPPSPALAYMLLHDTERTLRRAVVARLRQKYGDEWLVRGVPAALREKWQRRWLQEDQPKRHVLLDFADFPDYAAIIVDHPGNWVLFAESFQSPEALRESLNRLNLWRRRIAHVRGGWSKEEMLFIRVEAHRLFKALGYTFPVRRHRGR